MENVLFENEVKRFCYGHDGHTYWVDKWECYYPEEGKEGIRYFAKRVNKFICPVGGAWTMELSDATYYLRRDEFSMYDTDINVRPNEKGLADLVREWIFKDLVSKFGEAFAIYYVSDLDNFNPQAFKDRHNLKFKLDDIERQFEWYIGELQYHLDILKMSNKKVLQ